MKKRLVLTTILAVAIIAFCYADMLSITHTTTATNDLTVIVETNSRYIIWSMAVAFTNIGTGTVTLAHNRLGHTVDLKSIVVSGVLSGVTYFDAPYIIDGKQGDTLTLSTTNSALPAKIFLTIDR